VSVHSSKTQDTQETQRAGIVRGSIIPLFRSLKQKDSNRGQPRNWSEFKATLGYIMAFKKKRNQRREEGRKGGRKGGREEGRKGGREWEGREEEEEGEEGRLSENT